jgi:hypothetical protein
LKPTVVVVSNQQINLLHQTILGFRRESTMSSIRLSLNQNKLSSGRLSNGDKNIKNTFSTNLRLMYVSVRPETKPVPSHILDFLRAGLGSHVIYALGSPYAFGPIAQTHIHDYRTDDYGESGFGHFGAPVGGVEIKLTGINDEGTVLGKSGQVNINGPIVAGTGWRATELKAHWRKDGCLDVEYVART